MQELFIVAALDVLPAGGGLSWVRNRLSGKAELLEDSLSALIPHLAAWRTLEGHADALGSLGIGGRGNSMIAGALQELNAQGFLISDSQFRNSLGSQKKRARAGISSLSWCTRDRPEELKRSVGHYLKTAPAAGKAASMYVFDDSAEAAARTANRDALRGLSPSIRYMGVEQKKAFAQQIAKAGDGIDPETISFALFGLPECGVTIGANHNACLLATVGERMLSCDDDTLFDFVRSSGGATGVALSAVLDSTEYSFFKDENAMLQSVSPEHPNLLALHAEVLGSSVGECLARDAAQISLENCSAGMVHALMTEGGVVAATSVGVLGDSGLESERYLLMLPDASRERLLASEPLYRAAAENRLMHRAAPRTTISGGAYFQAMCVALDNSLDLPPFFPLGRNCDGVFAQTLRSCFPDHYIAHLPWAIRHMPPGHRAGGHEQVVDFVLHLTEIMNLLLVTFEGMSRDAAGSDRLYEAAGFFQDLSSLGDADFLEYLRSRYMPHLSRHVEYLDGLLQIYRGQPDFWARDVESHIVKLQDLPMAPDFCIPVDLRQGRADSEAVGLTRQIVGVFGNLLEAWPEIRAAAFSLREEGKEAFVAV
jgi:hypothetical protein